ncbi:flagellar protein FliT [Thermorudis peleae]|uniref:flagellar protein FliT n=1 Tax=Thermorudis peleae TaxID=1382356 RepID=UPI0018CD1F7C|nr:flagellar protein FliT [Thermorudis peleae]MBX6753889.1 flagellar protein FliT [Thermorudis peleae]
MVPDTTWPLTLACRLRSFTARLRACATIGDWQGCQAVLRERGALLADIANLDPRALTPAEREALGQALQEAREEDAALRERVLAVCERLQAELASLAQAQRLADGYYRATSHAVRARLFDQSI